MNIAETIGEYLPLQPMGRLWRGRCPFHVEEAWAASFIVFPETQSYHCFGCGISGDAATFVSAFVTGTHPAPAWWEGPEAWDANVSHLAIMAALPTAAQYDALVEEVTAAREGKP